MRFLVQIEVHDAIVGREADRQVRDALGAQVQRVMGSGKVREARASCLPARMCCATRRRGTLG